jgi:hypothetical protein
MDRLPLEVLVEIVTNLTPQSRALFARVSKKSFDAVEKFRTYHRRAEYHLRTYFGISDVQGMLEVLTSAKSVISGSMVLQLHYGERFKDSDIDIYLADYRSYKMVKTFLVGKEAYSQVGVSGLSVLADTYRIGVFVDEVYGRVSTFQKHQSKIQLIHGFEDDRGFLGRVISNFGATVVMNIWRNGIIRLAFPSHVSARKGWAEERTDWLEKYEKRNFKFTMIRNLYVAVEPIVKAMLEDI